VEGAARQAVDAEVIAEVPVALTVNGVVWLSFMCTPVDLEALAIGFLYNEGVIARREEVTHVEVCGRGESVDVLLDRVVQRPVSWRRTSGCVGGGTSVEGHAGPRGMPAAPGATEEYPSLRAAAEGFTLTHARVQRLFAELLDAQDLYATTGGVHSSALSDGERILVTAEDIGRHNTLDKIAGQCLLEGIAPRRRVLLTTGRVSSDMMQKAARIGAPIVVSRSSPTSLSLELAERWGMTVVGYARRDRFNVYTHPERIVA
jgi:FdhD protein